MKECSPPQHFTCRMSYVICHVSFVKCHVSHVTCHVSKKNLLDIVSPVPLEMQNGRIHPNQKKYIYHPDLESDELAKADTTFNAASYKNSNFNILFAADFDNPINNTRDGCGEPELNTKISSPPLTFDVIGLSWCHSSLPYQ